MLVVKELKKLSPEVRIHPEHQWGDIYPVHNAQYIGFYTLYTLQFHKNIKNIFLKEQMPGSQSLDDQQRATPK